MHLFYTPDIESDIYALNEEESLHCIRVLRLRKSDEIYLTDGKGNLFKAIITGDDQKRCTVRIIETFSNYKKRNYYIHLAIAPTKNLDRIEWFLEKATEIGIDEITPIICEHSERRKVNMERLNKVITSAVKQSLKAYHPILNSEKKFDEFIRLATRGLKFIGYCNDKTSITLKDAYKQGNDAIVLIGPEGDFSETEIQQAKENDYTPINLGDNRYRTETAALVTCHTIYLMNEL